MYFVFLCNLFSCSCVYNSVTGYEIKGHGGGAALADEERLLRNLKKRKRGSLEKAIELYTPYVSTVVYNVIGAAMSREDIEETVSDVFISLWKNAGSLDADKGCIRAYLGAAARNTAKNRLRRAFGHEELDETIVSDSSIPEEEAERREERRLLIDAVRALGEPDSEIFLRYYFYDEKISEISDTVGICTSTVKSKLARGRKKLREILGSKEVRQ